MKTKKTNRKFYNKWLYKVSLTVRGAYLFRIYTLDTLLENINDETKIKSRYISNLINQGLNRELFEKVVDVLKIHDSTTWAKRVERSTLDIYTNNQELYDTLSLQFHENILQRFEPEKSQIDNLDQDNIIVANKYPHNRYRHKVYLLPHKLANDSEEKIKYLEWLKLQSPRVTCSPAVESWFLYTNWNWDRRYILVEDERTLLLLKLRNPEVVGKIYNYVLIDK